MKNTRLIAVLVSSAFAFTAVAVASDGIKPGRIAGAVLRGGKDKDKDAKVLKIGDKVPDFTATDVNGKQVKFSDFAGKTVVLQWVNPGCPVCRKVTESGQVAQMITDAKAIDPNVVFLMVNSTASTASDPKVTADYLSSHKVQSTAALIDGDGKVGHMFDAKTTPDLFVVDSKGTLVYGGAFDDSSDRGETAGKTNYVLNTLKQLKAGQSVSPSTTKPYGCSVKYGK
jgi:peroxiredoxin